MSDRPDWDDQFRETEGERNARLATKRAQKSGMFRDHRCWKCSDGLRPCVVGNPRQCEYPHARND